MKIFGLNLFGKKNPRKEEIEENKIQMLAQIGLLIPIINSLLSNLREETRSETVAQTNIKEIKNRMGKVKSNLEDAEEYMRVLNLEFALKELKSAEKEISQIHSDNKSLEYLIKIGIMSRNDIGNISILKSNLAHLINNLSNPKY